MARLLLKNTTATTGRSWGVSAFNSGPFIISDETAAAFRMTIDGSGNVTFDTSTLYVDAVNDRVGIGTTSPGQPLDVRSVQGSGNLQLRLGTTAGHVFDIGRRDVDGYLSIQGTQVGNNSILLAPTSGNVGIGTMSPSSGKLQVVAATNTYGLYQDGGLATIKPSSTSGNQGLHMDLTNLASASNGILISAPVGWTGSFISGNLNGSNKFAISQGGGLIIQGTFTAPALANATGTYPLCWTAGGSISYAGACSSSDRRLKKDIEPLVGSLEKIAQLQGVSFLWKDVSKGKGRNIGFIAQDMEKVFPEFVRTEADGYRNIRYEYLVVPLAEAVKELYVSYDNLSVMNGNLAAEKAELQRSLDDLRRRVDKLETANCPARYSDPARGAR